MKIYKKILNFGYGICCLLPILYLVFGFLYVMKTGENGTFDFNNSQSFKTLGLNLEYLCSGELDTFLISVEWFEPFAKFNNWFALNMLGEETLNGAIGGSYQISVCFALVYAEWVVLVSFFRLFGSVFGCMINFADRMLDKIGGAN